MARRRRRAAFTLVETLVGIAILVAGFLPVYFLFIGTERQSIETVRMVKSLALAHALLEEAKALPAKRLPAMARATEEDFFAAVKREGGPDRHFTPLSAEERKFFARTVEVFEEEERVKRVRVVVTDLALERHSAGHRGETLLETLVIR